MKARATAPLLYKGTLGRMSDQSFAPGATVYVAPDGTCATLGHVPLTVSISSDRQRALSVALLDRLLAVVVVKRRDGSIVFARVYAEASAHQEGAAGDLSAALVKAGIHAAAPGVMRRRPVGADSALAISLPTEEELSAFHADEDRKGAILTFQVVAVLGTPPIQDVANQIASVAHHSCAQVCQNGVPTTVSICIDRLFTLGVDPRSRLVTFGDRTYSDCPSQPNYFPLDVRNKFADVCERSPGQSNACDEEPKVTTLNMWQDECHRLHIPFSWDGVYTGSDVDLKGQSGTSRKSKSGHTRIRIPGREFVGSTPLRLPGEQLPPDTDWKKPIIHVLNRDQELELEGIVDKSPASVVHIFPRYSVSKLCANAVPAEACECVDEGTKEDRECACGDRPQSSGCTCTADVGRFFACSDGNFKGMPCTRAKHCGDDGTHPCNATPVCRKTGSVFRIDKDNESARKCTSNADCTSNQCTPDGCLCSSDTDCQNDADYHQCGYLLFDLTEQGNEGAPDHIELKRRVKNSEDRRGVCVDAPKTSCKDDSDCSSGPCRGYLLGFP